MVARHVKLFKCPAPAAEVVIWVCSMQIMSQRVGNASVVLSSTAPDQFMLFFFLFIIIQYEYTTSYVFNHPLEKCDYFNPKSER